MSIINVATGRLKSTLGLGRCPIDNDHADLRVLGFVGFLDHLLLQRDDPLAFAAGKEFVQKVLELFLIELQWN